MSGPRNAMAAKNSGSSHVDLLIVGAGPAGLMAACWAAQYRRQMSTRIIDQKSGRTQTGHADGLQSRSLEILDAFGIVDPILRQGVADVDACYWTPNKETENIERRKRDESSPGWKSRFGQLLLNQGAVEQTFLDYLEEKGFPSVELNKCAESLRIPDPNEGDHDDKLDFPVAVTVRKLGENGEGYEQEATEIIHTRYLIACDGARSWTRHQLNVQTESSSEDSTWGVLDIVPITNFPDIRQACAIQSEPYGSIMTAPRENRIVRFYIHLRGKLKEEASQHSDNAQRTLTEMAERIMKPYNLTYKQCDWWSLYTIGQRIVKHFRPHERIFLAGDAAHTHSPMGGQGMNVSIQDTYNLTWKIGEVISGAADPSILETYHSERHPVAKELMGLDVRLVQAYEEDGSGTSGSVDHVREQYSGFMAGVDVTYPQSILVSKPDDGGGRSNIARSVTLGMRIPSFPVVYQCDGTPIQLQRRLSSGGLWRLLVFSGDLRQQQQMDALTSFAEAFKKKHSFLSRTISGNNDPIVEPLLIQSSPRTAINFFDLPDIFYPFDDKLGWDYWKVFADDGPQGMEPGQAYTGYGIDRKGRGCLILCRPDQHVAWVGGLDDVPGLSDYLSGFSRVDV